MASDAQPDPAPATMRARKVCVVLPYLTDLAKGRCAALLDTHAMTRFMTRSRKAIDHCRLMPPPCRWITRKGDVRSPLQPIDRGFRAPDPRAGLGAFPLHLHRTMDFRC